MTQPGRYARPVWFMVGINVTLLVLFLSTHLVECFSEEPTDTANPTVGIATTTPDDSVWISTAKVPPDTLRLSGEGWTTWTYPSDCNTCTCSAPVITRDGKRYRNEGMASCSCTLANCVHDEWVEIPEVGK